MTTSHVRALSPPQHSALYVSDDEGAAVEVGERGRGRAAHGDVAVERGKVAHVQRPSRHENFLSGVTSPGNISRGVFSPPSAPRGDIQAFADPLPSRRDGGDAGAEDRSSRSSRSAIAPHAYDSAAPARADGWRGGRGGVLSSVVIRSPSVTRRARGGGDEGGGGGFIPDSRSDTLASTHSSSSSDEYLFRS